MICRYGESDDANITDWLVITTLADSLAKHISVDIVPMAEPSQRDDLWEVDQRLMRVYPLTIRAFNDHDYELLQRFWLFKQAREFWNAATGTTRNYDPGIPSSLYYSFEAEMACNGFGDDGQRIRDDLKRIGQFDFTTLQFNEDAAAMAVP